MKRLFFVLSTALLATLGNAQTTPETAPQPIVFVEDTTPRIDYNLVHERFASLQKTIPLVHNEHSHKFVEFFAFQRQGFVKAMLEKQHKFFPIFEKILAKYGLPDELKYLSMIESRLEPSIVSYAGAAGLWQFMPRTAKLDFGLRVDSYIDERLDPYIATETACRYFLQLGRIFDNDWEMMLASYNTGPGNASRAMRRSGKRGYWEVYPFLHKQTRGYVPQYSAVIYMMHYANDHGIVAENIEAPYNFETVEVNSYLNLRTLARVGQMSYEEIKTLNPHILTDILPGSTVGFPLRLPKEQSAFFFANKEALLDSARRLPSTVTMLAANTTAASSNATGGGMPIVYEDTPETHPAVVVVASGGTLRSVQHLVKKGETLTSLATKYGVSREDLGNWNGVSGDAKIRIGQGLVVYTSQEEVADSPKTERLKSAKKYHTVQRGDTLWNISQRYGGMTVEDLRRLNGLRSNDVRPGQKIRLI